MKFTTARPRRWGVVAVLGLLAPLVAAAMTTSVVKLTCPIDGKPFSTRTVSSGSSVGMYLDFMPFGPTPAPWPLLKCPGNGFVIYKQGFSAEELTRLRAFVSSDRYRELSRTHTDYALAAELMSVAGEPASKVADARLKATWEARGPSVYRDYAIEALAAQERVLADPSSTDAERLTATLAAGELERRLRLFDRARKRFEDLAVRGELPPQADRMVRLQLQLIGQESTSPAMVPDR